MITTLEIYSNDMHGSVAVRQPKSLEDAINFLDRTLSDITFSDVYLDVNDEARPTWQESWSLKGVESKQEALEFIKGAWDASRANM